MGSDSPYGTRPDLLPPSSVKLTRINDRPEWLAVEGIEILSFETHRELENKTFDPFVRFSDGTVDWDKAPSGLIVHSTTATVEALIAALRDELTKGGSCIFLWDSLAVPSIRVHSRLATQVAEEAVQIFAEFWIIHEGSSSFFEFSSFSGRLAYLPGARC